MALVAIAVTLGTPNSVGQVPITVANLAAAIALAVADLTALGANIVVAQVAAATADTDAGVLVTDATTADGAAATNLSQVSDADAKVGTTNTDFDAFAAALIAITGDTYNTTTNQFTFGGATGLTHAQIAGALGTALNLVGADIVTAKASSAAAKTQATTLKANTATVLTDASTTKTATATAKTDVNLLSTSAVAADLTSSQTIIASANVYIQTDGTIVTNVALLNGALVNALTFVRDSAILPT